MKSLFILFPLMFASLAVFAKPVGEVPLVSDGRMHFDFAWRSDLWTSPYKDKESPVRILDTDVHIPLVREDDRYLSFAASSEGLNLGRSDVYVGDRDVALGQDLRAEHLALGAHRVADGIGSFSSVVAYASASDEPFAGADTLWWEWSGTYRSKPQGNTQWLLGANYSKNRGFYNNRLFPYVGFIYKLDARWTTTFGFPFVIVQFKEGIRQAELKLTAGSGKIELTQELSDDLSLFGRLGLETYSYLHTHRIDDSDRLFYQERFTEVGIVATVTDQTTVGASLGYSFGRSIFEGENFYEPKGQRVKLEPDAFGALSLGFRL